MATIVWMEVAMNYGTHVHFHACKIVEKSHHKIKNQVFILEKIIITIHSENVTVSHWGVWSLPQGGFWWPDALPNANQLRIREEILVSATLFKNNKIILFFKHDKHTYKITIIQNMAYWPTSTQASYTIGSGATIQENQQAARMSVVVEFLPSHLKIQLYIIFGDNASSQSIKIWILKIISANIIIIIHILIIYFENVHFSMLG